MRRIGRKRQLSAIVALVALLPEGEAAFAIDGGSVAGRNRLSQATVSISTLTAGNGTLGVARCSGVLISPKLVLTAAHCVNEGPLASAVVAYNGARPVSPAIPVVSLARYAVPREGIPSNYAGLVELSLDTAVLRLASPVRGHQPIRIGHGARPPADLRLAGAGLSGEGLGVLKTTHLEPIAMTSTGLIIAAAQGAEVCKGDSGGPVLADGPRGLSLWGVASAVLTSRGPCGHIVVVAPAVPSL